MCTRFCSSSQDYRIKPLYVTWEIKFTIWVNVNKTTCSDHNYPKLVSFIQIVKSYLLSLEMETMNMYLKLLAYGLIRQVPTSACRLKMWRVHVSIHVYQHLYQRVYIFNINMYRSMCIEHIFSTSSSRFQNIAYFFGSSHSKFIHFENSKSVTLYFSKNQGTLEK